MRGTGSRSRAQDESTPVQGARKAFHTQPLPTPVMVFVTTTTHFAHVTPAATTAHDFPMYQAVPSLFYTFPPPAFPQTPCAPRLFTLPHRQPPKPGLGPPAPGQHHSQLLLCPSSAKDPSVLSQHLTMSYCSHLFMVYFCKPSNMCVMRHIRAPINVWITAGLRNTGIPPDTSVLHYRHTTQRL